MKSNRTIEHFACVRRLVCLVMVTLAGGCNLQPTPAAKTEQAAASASAYDQTPRAHNLTIYGYNYTNTGIGSFEVNGQGGGTWKLVFLTLEAANPPAASLFAVP